MPKSILSKVTRDQLETAVKNSQTFIEVLGHIGYKQTTSKKALEKIEELCDLLEIECSVLKSNNSKKICSCCNELKSFDEFYRSNNRSYSICKECTKNNQNSKYYDKSAELNEYKTQLGCKKCGDTRYYLIDFHHIDPSQKNFSISDNPNAKLSTIKEELDKCIPLCSNCHREFHFLERINKTTLEDYLK